MKKILALTLALFLAHGPAFAQTFPLNNIPVGKGPGKQGWTAVAPGAENSCFMIIAGAPTFATCPGAGTGGTVSTLNAGDGITLTPNPTTTVGTIRVTAGAANTMKGSLNGSTTSDIALTACTLTYQITKWVAGTGWQCGLNPVLPSRAVAATLNLSAFSTITTQGYILPGDGGGGTFINVASAPFIDSFITTYSIQGGSGYTNGGPYYGNLFIVGSKPFSVGTVTVAGGAFSAVNIAGTPGLQCAVGDVLAFAGSAAAVAAPASGMPAGGTGGSITVTGCSTPLASFTDSTSNHWQFVPDTFPNVLQFGAKGDWNGTDATATDNFAPVQAAVWFTSNKSSTSFDGGGYWGGRVNVPQGSYKMCGSTYFVLPNNVILEGASSAAASNLKLCDTYSTSTNAYEICDPNWHFACFGSRFQNMAFFAGRNITVSGGVSMIHSNAIQDMGGVYNSYIYSGHRIAVHFEKGFGGASWVGIHNVSISQNSANHVMIKIGNTNASGLNYGSTIVSIENIILGGPSSAPFQQMGGLQILGGFVNVKNLHCEIITEYCISVGIPIGANGEQVSLQNINSQGCASVGTCRGVIELDSTNNLGNTTITMVPGSASHTHVISNGQAGGVSYDNAIKAPIICTTTCHTEVIP